MHSVGYERQVYEGRLTDLAHQRRRHTVILVVGAVISCR
jgi:hypothetical protein